jgi:hypothetical protein
MFPLPRIAVREHAKGEFIGVAVVRFLAQAFEFLFLEVVVFGSQGVVLFRWSVQNLQ